MTNPLKDFTALHWLLLAVVVVAICDIRYRSRTPVYNYYRENITSLRNDVERFKGIVIGELIPRFENLCSQTNYVDSSAATTNNVVLPSGLVNFYDVLSGPVVAVDDYRPCIARVGEFDVRGVYIDSWYYQEGDTFLGRLILSVSPECTKCDGFTIVPRRSFSMSDTKSKGGLL